MLLVGVNISIFFISLCLDILISSSLLHFFIYHQILLCGDVETNPGPKTISTLKIFHWNLNSLQAHDFIKLSSLKAFNTIHKYDVICISETFLDSTMSSDDSALEFNGYKLVRSDHPNDIKRGGIAIYYKETLPIKFLKISNLNECLICEISFEKKSVS